MPKMSSVSGSWLQIIKLCVNLNSAIHRCNAVDPSADMVEPSAVLNLALHKVSVYLFNTSPKVSFGGGKV